MGHDSIFLDEDDTVAEGTDTGCLAGVIADMEFREGSHSFSFTGSMINNGHGSVGIACGKEPSQINFGDMRDVFLMLSLHNGELHTGSGDHGSKNPRFRDLGAIAGQLLEVSVEFTVEGFASIAFKLDGCHLCDGETAFAHVPGPVYPCMVMMDQQCLSQTLRIEPPKTLVVVSVVPDSEPPAFSGTTLGGAELRVELGVDANMLELRLGFAAAVGVPIERLDRLTLVTRGGINLDEYNGHENVVEVFRAEDASAAFHVIDSTCLDWDLLDNSQVARL